MPEQYKTKDKPNEIKAIPALLDWLNLQGCIVTIDTMGYQKAIAEQLLGQKADYVFG
jgi:predicted transposase YbfD/YdcC